MTCKIQAALLAIAVCSAEAQLNTIDIKVGSVISPDQPSVTIEAWAVWDPAQYAFREALFDFLASADAGGFSEPERMLKGPTSDDGYVAPDGDAVTGVLPFQLHFPAANIFADTADPILIWRVTWSTSDFTPRLIDLHTVMSEFILYIDENGNSKSFINGFAEGSGVIQVVPAPGAGACVAGVCLMLFRRRAALGAD